MPGARASGHAGAGGERGHAGTGGERGAAGAGGERGAAGVLAVAVIAVVVCVAAVAVGVGGAFGARRVAAVAADAAALAAADVASGLRPGVPCQEADRLATANGARLEWCELDGVVAVVGASVPYLGLPARASASARAGPPGTGP